MPVILWCLNRLSSTFFLMTSRFNTNAFSLSLHNQRWWRTLNLFCNRNSRKERANIDCECWWWEHWARTIFLFNFRCTFTTRSSYTPFWLYTLISLPTFFSRVTVFLSVSKAIKSDEKYGDHYGKFVGQLFRFVFFFRWCWCWKCDFFVTHFSANKLYLEWHNRILCEPSSRE